MSIDDSTAATEDLVTSMTSTSPMIAVVDVDPRMRTRLAVQLGEVVQAALCASFEEVDDVIRGLPVVIIAGPSKADDAGVDEVSEYVRTHTNAQVIIATDSLSTALLQNALRAGISDVLVLPFETAQLEEAIERAEARLPDPSQAAPTNDVTDAGGSEAAGRAITVFSTKGGAGKSFVASNLAISLAMSTDKPVVLVDADLQFGDVAVMLKLTPQQTIVDAVNTIDRLDAVSLQTILMRHDRSGLYVLPAPTEPAFADQISAANMVQIINILREFAGYIVIDTPAHFNEVVLGLIEASDDIVLVAGMDIPNIKNVKIGLQVLRLLDIPSSKLKLVLNRANAKVKLDIPEVERTLQLKADCLIPSDMLVPKSVNKGVPAVLDEPRSAVARSIDGLAELLKVKTEAQRQRA